jgi:hypothetical protein
MATTWPSACLAQELLNNILTLRRSTWRLGPAWQWSPSIVVVSDQGDTLLEAVHEAVGFWNAELSSLGTPFRLGSANHIVGDLTAKDFYSSDRDDLFPPKELRQIDSDMIVSFHNHGPRSFARSWRKPNKKVLVSIEMPDPSAALNRTPNIVAHEFGHAIGLGHTAAQGTLMCGLPARCYFRVPKEGIIPLTEAEKIVLQEMYPAVWEDRILLKQKDDAPSQPGAG